MKTQTAPVIPLYPADKPVPAPLGHRYLEKGEPLIKGAMFFNRTSQRWEVSKIPYVHAELKKTVEHANVYVVPSSDEV